MKKINSLGEIVTRKWIYAVELGNGLFGKPLKIKRRFRNKSRREIPKYKKDTYGLTRKKYLFRKKGIKKIKEKEIFVKIVRKLNFKNAYLLGLDEFPKFKNLKNCSSFER